MEYIQLTKPVQIPADNTVGSKLSECLRLGPEAWEQLQEERKSTLTHFGDPFIKTFLKGEEKPAFTKIDVMNFLQENGSQQQILLLAAEMVHHHLGEALEKMQQQMDPMERLLKAMLSGKDVDELLKQAKEELGDDTPGTDSEEEK